MFTSGCRLPHSTRKLTTWQEGSVIGGLLALLTVLCFWPQVVQGKVLYWGDIGLYFTPMQTFFRESLHTGHLPLWNPLILCGTPYFGNPQTWPLYPFSALLAFVSAPHFLSLTVAFHVWLAGLATYFFLRRTLLINGSAALFGALIFMFGGQFVSKEQFPNMVQAASYLPLLLLLLDRLLRAPHGGNALGLGAALGLQVLAAHAQMTLLTVYLLCAYGLFTLWHRRADKIPGQKIALLLCLSGLIAFGLAAGQLLPTLELLRDATRHRLSFHTVNRFYLPVDQIANFFLPTLYGHPLQNNFKEGWRGNFWETCCYIGWLPSLLAIAAGILAWQRKNQSPARFWSLIFVFGFWMALGGAGGLYHLAYWALPGFRSFHDPARCLLWAAFALAALAAAGLQEMQFRLPKQAGLITLALLLLTFADLTHFDRSLYPLTTSQMLTPKPPFILALENDPQIRMQQARLLAPDSGRTWLRFTSRYAYRANIPEYQSQWADTLTPNLMMPYGLPDAYGYEPVMRRDTQTVIGTATQALRAEAKPSEQTAETTWAGFLGVRAIVTMRAHPPESTMPGLRPLLSEPTLKLPGRPQDAALRLYLAQNTRWQPRARLMIDFQCAPSQSAALAMMTDSLQKKNQLEKNQIDLGQTAIITGQIPFAAQKGNLRAASIEASDPDSVVVNAEAMRPSLLILADTNSPGWHATVDGKEQRILTANYCLRAVILPAAGLHRVVFTYHPTAFLAGLYLSLLTLAALSGAVTRIIARQFWGTGVKKQEKSGPLAKGEN